MDDVSDGLQDIGEGLTAYSEANPFLGSLAVIGVCVVGIAIVGATIVLPVP